MDRLERFGRFEWDPLKDQLNEEKHKLNFSDAIFAFFDQNRILERDDKHSNQEERWYCIGMVVDRVVTVRFTWRGRTLRILGAGFWKRGRKKYEKKENKIR